MTPSSKARKRPTAAEARRERVADDAAVSAILDLLTDGVATLPEALDRGEEARRARAEAARELLASPELKKAARADPDLGKSITSARKELDRQDAGAEQALAELREAGTEWHAALKSLHDPVA